MTTIAEFIGLGHGVHRQVHSENKSYLPYRRDMKPPSILLWDFLPSSDGTPMCETQEIKEASERRIEEELGAQEDYATEFADQRFVPRIPLSLILSIRRLVK